MSGAQLGWAVEAMIASTLLMVLVLLARRHVREAFGPQIAYALWALPLLRLVLPRLPHQIAEQATPPLSAMGDTLNAYVVMPVAMQLPTPVATSSIWPSLGQGLALFWIVGAGAFLTFQLLRHWRFRTRLLATAEPIEAIEGVRVVASDGAPGPLAFGIWHRYVAFPRDFAERYDADERDLALAHELGHHARGDLIANWIALAVLALHWFNPIAWRAFHAFRADQELANDARVLKGRSRTDRHVYACAIVKAAHGRALSGACHLHTIDDLKGRLKMLTTSPKSRRQLALGGATVSLLVLGGLGATASGTPAAAALTKKVERTLGVDLTTVAAPEQAEAPQSPALPATAAAPMPASAPIPADHAIAMAPAEPMAPIAAPMEEAPPVAETPRARVYTIRNGRTIQVVDGSTPMPVMPPIPMVRSETCGTAGSDVRTSYTINGRTKQQVTVICTDRIERMARQAALSSAQAARTAVDAKHMAGQNMAIALASIATARNSIMADRNLSDEARRDALQGLNEATEELKAEMAHPEQD